jgi:TIR domain
MDAFISHSSRNRATASKLEKALEDAGLRVWLDDSEIRLGVLLGKELQDSIRSSRVLLLLWSRPAALSRWVASEWLTAFHMHRFIVPCALDDTPLPQCLQGSVFLRGRRVTPAMVERLARAVREAPDGSNPLAPLMRSESPEVKQAIAGIAGGQQALGERLSKRELAEAAELQALLDDLVGKALRAWPLEPMIVNLAGYNLKNAYMLRHWDAIQAGRAPDDPLLAQAEQRFFETLAIDPADPSALNGLGSILMFRRDLKAAEFFVLAAIAQAHSEQMDYPAAEQDLALIRRFKERR